MDLDAKCALILLGCVVVTWLGGKALEKSKHRKGVLWGIVGANVLMLGLFKYTNFVIDSVSGVLFLIGGRSHTWI